MKTNSASMGLWEDLSLESAIFEKIQFSIKASPSDDDVSTKIQCQIFLTLWTQNSEYLTGFYKLTLRGKCPYSNFFWSVFFRIRTEHRYYVSLGIQSECGKFGPEKLRIQTLFMQCYMETF